jgi:uncharacterized protein with HEPN domain
MSKSQRLYLEDLLEYIGRIEAIAAAGKETFLASAIHQDAAIRNFEVIGEIVKRLAPGLTAKHPHIPWSDYAGFRDVLIHQYDRVLIEIVWESTQNDIQPLKDAVRRSSPPCPLKETPHERSISPA